MGKNYVLDANILLHDPSSIDSFVDNTVIIPVGVIEEIDRFKKEMTNRGSNARAVARRLDALRENQSLVSGVEMANGGTLKVYCDPERPLGGAVDGDTEVLQVARAIQKADPATPVTIVTKDINLRIRADVFGLHSEDYESDRVMLADVEPHEFELMLDPEQLDRFQRDGELFLTDAASQKSGNDSAGSFDSISGSGSSAVSAVRTPVREATSESKPAALDENWCPNEYGLLRSLENERTTLLARVSPDGRKVIALRAPKDGICGIRPRNKEQHYAIDALLDDRIELVTLMGKAGTGKTLLAMAAAMHTTLAQKRYHGIVVARPIVPVGRDMGFLPGEVENKLAPWMTPIADTIDFLLDTGGPIRGYKDSATLLRIGLIEIQPLSYIRGRSISNRFVVIDETQNLTPLEVKTVITRIGRGAKVVLTGDPYQIDNPYVDSNSNGFSTLTNRFHGQPSAAHVSLHKGERGPLAELAANLL